jgi:outer membrane protein OmpA-like peptidoglycan-associated protein
MPDFARQGVFAALTLATLALPLPALAQVASQDDPAALELIEQLRPRTRGIRLPAPAPAPDPGPAEAPAPAPRPAPPTTTAPEGVAAVSITVNFPSGSATLTRQAQETLAPLGRALFSAELAPFRFRIEGHTDSVGAEAMNQRLSARRAQAVRDYLVSRFGVSGQRLEAVGLGESRPLVDVGDGVDEPRNRRVQVINLDD